MGAFASERVLTSVPACWLPLEHAASVTVVDGIELVALCDPDANALAKGKDRYAPRSIFLDDRKLLAEIALDLVAIATRTQGRASMMERCIAAGVRALHVEKPLCNGVAELDRLEGITREAGTFVSWGAIRRMLPPYREALAAFGGNAEQLLLEAQVSFGLAPLFWTHPHSVDLLLFAAGDRVVESVAARFENLERSGARVHNDPRIDTATIYFADGFTGRIGKGLGSDFVLTGQTCEVAVLDDGASLTYVRYDSGGSYPSRFARVPSRSDGPAGTALAIRHLVGCLDGNEEALAANNRLRRDIFKSQRILFAFVQSHLEGGRPVRLDEIDPQMIIDAQSGGLPA